jgi:hypothetical protein
MSIAPPVGAMSRYLTKLVSSQPYMNAREAGKKFTEILPAPLRHAAKRAEEAARVALGTGTLFRGNGLLLYRPRRRPQSRRPPPDPRNIKDRSRRPRPHPRHHDRRAKATFPPKIPPTKCTASKNSTSSPAHKPNRASAPRPTPKFSRNPDRRSQTRRKNHRHHRRHARRHRPRSYSAMNSPTAPSMSASPSSTLSPSPQASPPKASSPFVRDLLHIPAARLRSGRARRRHSKSPRPFRDGPRRSRRRRRPDARRVVRHRLSRLPAELCPDGRQATNPNSSTWSPPPPRMTIGPIAFRYPRGEGTGIELPAQGEGNPSKSAKAASCRNSCTPPPASTPTPSPTPRSSPWAAV